MSFKLLLQNYPTTSLHASPHVFTQFPTIWLQAIQSQGHTVSWRTEMESRRTEIVRRWEAEGPTYNLYRANIVLFPSDRDYICDLGFIYLYSGCATISRLIVSVTAWSKSIYLSKDYIELNTSCRQPFSASRVIIIYLYYFQSWVRLTISTKTLTEYTVKY